MLIRRSRRSRGLSLVELVVASVIVGVGMVGMCQLYLASMWTYQKAHYMAIATQRAQYELEKTRSVGFAALTPDNATSLVPGSYASGSYTALTSGRGVQFTVADLPSGSGTITITKFRGYNYLLLATIQITWGGMTKAQSPVSIITLISKAP